VRLLLAGVLPEALQPAAAVCQDRGFSVTRRDTLDRLESDVRLLRPDVVVLAPPDEPKAALDLVRRLRAEPSFRHVPVILLVAAERVEAADDLAMLEWMAHPVLLPQLLGRIRSNAEVKRLIDHGERRSERLSALLEISRALTSTLDSGAILYAIARKLSEEMELVRCSFIVPDLAQGIGRVIACKDDPNIHSLEINLANYPEIIQVLRSGRRVIIADVERDPIMAGIRKFADVFRDQSIMTLPLRFHDDVVGVLQIRKKSQRQGFSAREVEYCELLANAAASALKNAQLYEDIEKHNAELRRQKRELEQLSAELRRGNQELIELQQLKEDFTAMIVHDLRSPMMIVQGVFDLLGHKHRGSPADKELIDDGIGVTKRILSLINNLLEVSKIEAGELTLHPEELDLGELLGEAVAPFQVVASVRGISLETRVAAGIPVIHADRRCLGQVLDNLIANAVKFTPDGGRVVASAEPDGDGRGVRILVEDTGPGVAAEDLPNIFKRFRQGGTKGAGKGTGLGLTIVDLMVAAHGGRVEVDSELGKGSRFTVRLPAEPPGRSIPLVR
jgi:signal transduction histidine kinase